MRRIIYLDKKPFFLSAAAVGGYEEKHGPLGESFDFCDGSDLFGERHFEESESEMERRALNIALKKAGIGEDILEVLLSGDLQNQCVASSGGLYTFGAPYIGLYSACSTATEALMLLSLFLSKTEMTHGAAVTSSHNSAAERQFRTPLEYGAQRPPSAQWTATASGAFIMSSIPYRNRNVYVDNLMVGKVVDGGSADGSNMGGAMARAAFDSIYTYLSLSGGLGSIDCIITGDLGYIGSDILKDMLARECPGAADIHQDCGTLLYSKEKKGLKAGASGCGCSASVLACHFLPSLESGKYKNILFLSTGALMNPISVMRGNNILGIAPVINIRSN